MAAAAAVRGYMAAGAGVAVAAAALNTKHVIKMKS
jgi:hypothetical protein